MNHILTRTFLAAAIAVFALNAKATSGPNSAPECALWLIETVPAHQLTPSRDAMVWQHRLALRKDNVQVVDLPPTEKNEQIAEELTRDLRARTKLMAGLEARIEQATVMLPEDEVNRVYNELDTQRDAYVRVFSRYLLARGVAHLGITYGTKPVELLILPGTETALNRSAKDLFATSGSALMVGGYGRNHFRHSENCAYVLFASVLDGDWPGFLDRLKVKIESQAISEIEYLTSISAAEAAFLIDPENAVLNSLRFLTLGTGPGSMLRLSMRAPFRTGRVADLSPEIARPLGAMIRVHNQGQGRGAIAAAVRDVDGRWTASLPEVLAFDAKTVTFGGVYADIKSHLRQKKPDDAKRTPYPDLFFIAAGKNHFTPDDLAFLESLTAAEGYALNSISYVILNDTVAYGPIYYVHTVNFDRGRSTTADADQLKTAFNRDQFIYDAVYNRIPGFFDVP